jgi:hypothetical protein
VTCLLVQHLWADSVLSRHTFGWRFLHTNQWDPYKDNYGALPSAWAPPSSSPNSPPAACPTSSPL